MKNKSIFSILALTVMTVLTLSSVQVGQAQTNSGTTIKISPVLFDNLTANPGEALSGIITVSNPGSEQLALYPEAQNFLPKEGNEEGLPTPTTNDTPYAIMDWIKFNKDTVNLAPGQKDDIKFTIDIPKTANPGGHYGMVVFITKAPEGSPESTQLKVEAGLASLILLNVNGNVTESGEVVEFSTSGLTKDAQTNTPVVNFDLRFKNTGNTHFKPHGTIKITNWMGTQVDEIQLEGENVVPGSTRKMVTAWKPQGSLYGKYTATVEGTYGTNNKPFKQSVSFGDYHFTTIVIILIIVILIILFIKMSSKSYKDELSKEIKEELKQ